MVNMSMQTSIPRKWHFTVYIKNIFSKLFIAVDTAKLCKNCLSYEAKKYRMYGAEKNSVEHLKPSQTRAIQYIL